MSVRLFRPRGARSAGNLGRGTRAQGWPAASLSRCVSFDPSPSDWSRKTKRKRRWAIPRMSPGSKTAALDALAVDPGPIGAAQVANEDLAIAKGQAAVAAGYPRRVEADLAIPIAADECQRVIEVKGGVPVQRDEVRVHDQNRQSGRERRSDAGEPAAGARPTRLAARLPPLGIKPAHAPRWGHGLLQIRVDHG